MAYVCTAQLGPSYWRRIGAEKANMEKGKYGEILLSRAKMEKCDYMVFKPIVTANYH